MGVKVSLTPWSDSHNTGNPPEVEFYRTQSGRVCIETDDRKIVIDSEDWETILKVFGKENPA